MIFNEAFLLTNIKLCDNIKLTTMVNTFKEIFMKTIGNILWFLFTGLFSALAWFFLGLIWCITIIGIPFGKQCFKLAALAAVPFGASV